MKTVRRIRTPRKYSKDFKLSRVRDYERGISTVNEMSRMYGIRPKVLYDWIYKFSTLNKKKVVVVEKEHSHSEKLKAYEKRIKELEHLVGIKQIKIEYLERMICIAEEELGMDIKKNLDTSRLSGSQKTEKR